MRTFKNCQFSRKPPRLATLLRVTNAECLFIVYTEKTSIQSSRCRWIFSRSRRVARRVVDGRYPNLEHLRSTDRAEQPARARCWLDVHLLVVVGDRGSRKRCERQQQAARHLPSVVDVFVIFSRVEIRSSLWFSHFLHLSRGVF